MTHFRRSSLTHLIPATLRPLPLVLGMACIGSPTLVGISGCGADSNSDVGSTDTGNPPVINGQKLRVTASGADVVVSGEVGAVPGDASVEVTNLSSGESRSTTAADDGSFEVTVAGSVDDEYRVDVEVGGRKSSTNVSATSDTDQPAFIGKDFLLESAEGFTPVADTTVRLSFDESELRFSAGCNSHFGEYTLCGEKLCVDGFGSTAIGCPPDLGAQDQWLSEFFRSTPTLDYEGDTLILIGMDATLEFLDREVANPDRPLTGRTWTIDTFIMGDVASNVPLQDDPTVRFDDDGSFEAYTTCNTLAGAFEVDGRTLTLSDVTTTDIACTDPGVQAAEQHIAAVLGTGEVDFEIDANRLDLNRGQLGLSAVTD